MNVSKLLVQDFPPTREEFDALNQGTKNWTMYALVDHYAVPVQSIQRKPYTAMQVAYDARGDVGENTYTGEGFSKVVWPDKFCADTGFRLARMRAIRLIVKHLLVDGIAYDTLVDRWNRYLDIAEKHRLNAIAEAEERAAQEAQERAARDAEVAVDLAEEGGDESVATMLVHTRAGQPR